MKTLKEFFRYEFVSDQFVCEDCDGIHDVVRCTCWFADEGDREVVWYQCCACLRGEFQLDTRDSNVPRELSAWLKTDKREPLIVSYDLPSPEELGGRTLGEAILEILRGDA